MENIGVIRKGTINNRTLDFNGKPICRATVNTNELGTYIVGNKLYDNGRLVAVSSQENPQLIITDTVKFGEVRLDTDGICINITLENYNKLYNREEVPGYKYFDPYDVYNIVDNVSQAELITYQRLDDHLLFTGLDGETVIDWGTNTYVLYNNIVGENVYYDENLEKTVTQYNSPYIGVHYYNTRVPLDENNKAILRIPVFIDSYFSNYFQGVTVNNECRQTVTGPYTIELRIKDDDSRISKKTVYAGDSFIDTPIITEDDLGKLWFTLRVIDSEGVASATHYLHCIVQPNDYQDPDYQPPLWEVDDSILTARGIVFDDDFDDSTDPVYPGEAIGIPIEDLTPTVKAKLDAWNDFILQAYKNKVALNQLFEDALDSSKTGGRQYSGIKLPKHRYCVCVYNNVGNDSNNPIFNNDTPKYYYCELEATASGNKVKAGTLEECTENDVISDYKQRFRLSSDPTKIDWYRFGEYGTKAISQAITEGSVNITSPSNSKYSAGKYYFVLRSSASCGNPLTCPSNFTLHLNDSVIKGINQYDFNPMPNDPKPCIFELSGKDNVCVKHGTFKLGVATYDWYRAMARMSYRRVGEHNTPIIVNGNHFCSFEHITFQGSIGFVTEGSITSSYTVSSPSSTAFSPRGVTTANYGSGMYDNKRLALTNELESDSETIKTAIGTITDSYSDIQTMVLADTTILYENNDGSDDSTIGYMLLDRNRYNNGEKYIYVGYTTNYMTKVGTRREIFVFFYNNSDEVVKIVKSRTTYLIRIPDDASKVRIMCYGHSPKSGTSDLSNWGFVGILQVRGDLGLTFRHCHFKECRAAIASGSGLHILYDDITFTDQSCSQIVYPDGETAWDTITPHCIDLESGGALGKYITYNNIRATVTEGRTGVRSICLQHGESVDLTNCDVILAEWGIWSGSIKNNNFINHSSVGTSRCLHVTRRDAVLYHRPVNWENNYIESEPMYGYVTNGSFVLLFDIASLTHSESIYKDTREVWLPFRRTVLNGHQGEQTNFDKLALQNTKEINRSFNAGRNGTANGYHNYWNYELEDKYTD